MITVVIGEYHNVLDTDLQPIATDFSSEREAIAYVLREMDTRYDVFFIAGIDGNITALVHAGSAWRPVDGE